MIFADTALAARIEAAECRMVIACGDATRRRPDADVWTLPVAGGLATYTGERAPTNKVAGLGFAGPVSADDLAEIEREFDRRRTPVQVELSNLAEPSIGSMLTRRGYSLVGYENVLGIRLPIAPPHEFASRITISTLKDGDFEAWMKAALDGFAAPDTQGLPSHESFPREDLERVGRDLASNAGFMRYWAHLDGRPAGTATLRMSEGVAHLCGASTLPQHRRCGVQSALLAHRLAVAADAGCDLAVMVTSPATKSQENAQRRGFELLYTRAILLRDIRSDS